MCASLGSPAFGPGLRRGGEERQERRTFYDSEMVRRIRNSPRRGERIRTLPSSRHKFQLDSSLILAQDPTAMNNGQKWAQDVATQ